MELEIKFLKMLEYLTSAEDIYVNMLILEGYNDIYLTVDHPKWSDYDVIQLKIPIKDIIKSNKDSYIYNLYVNKKYIGLVEHIERDIERLSEDINYFNIVLSGLNKIKSDDKDYLDVLNGCKKRLSDLEKWKAEKMQKMADCETKLLKASIELTEDNFEEVDYKYVKQLSKLIKKFDKLSHTDDNIIHEFKIVDDMFYFEVVNIDWNRWTGDFKLAGEDHVKIPIEKFVNSKDNYIIEKWINYAKEEKEKERNKVHPRYEKVTKMLKDLNDNSREVKVAINELRTHHWF